MNLIWGWLLPRRKIYQTSADEQIDALQRPLYVLSDHCIKESLARDAATAQQGRPLQCACIHCKPDAYCVGRTETGEPCPEPKWYPDEPGKRQWCRRHYAELLKRQLEAGGKTNGGADPPAVLRGLFAAAAFKRG